MKVFVCDHRFDALERGICGCFWICQHAGGVKNIKPFVLHRAHIEIVDRDDHKNVEIVFASIDFFVPTHRALQRLHRVRTFIEVFVFDKDAQKHFPSAAGHKRIVDTGEVAGNEGKKIARLFKRIFPFNPMSFAFTAGDLTLRNFVAVRQQHRITRFLSTNCRHKARHHIGTVEVIGNTAKAFGLALRTEHFLGFI